MSPIEHRAARLLNELEAWLAAEEIKPPPYVQTQIDQLKKELGQ